jgi:hypothetical protein
MYRLYSAPLLLSIYSLDDDDYLIMYINFLLLFYWLVLYQNADASMDFVELQINEWMSEWIWIQTCRERIPSSAVQCHVVQQK